MHRHASILPVFALALVVLAALAGCGGKAAEDNSSSSSSSNASPATPAAGALLEKSLYDDGPRAGDSAVDAASVAAGEKLFSSKGCTACHAWGKKMTGPDLKGVTMRRTAAWMENQILHPDVMTKTDPISHGLFATFALQMPKQGLTPEEAKQVIEYLKQRDKNGK